jgi:hypothetical protein
VQRCNFRSEEGSAVIEFLAFALALQIPILILANQINVNQRDQLAAQYAARQIVQTVIQAENETLAEDRITALLADIKVNFKLSASSLRYQVTCDQGDCFVPDALVRSQVTISQVVETSSEVR